MSEKRNKSVKSILLKLKNTTSKEEIFKLKICPIYSYIIYKFNKEKKHCNNV